MTHYLLHFLAFFSFCIIWSSCQNNQLVLNASNFSGVDEIDTIEHYPDKKMYVLGLVRYGAMDDFTYDLAILRKAEFGRDSVCYEIDNDKNSFRVSKQYVAFVKGVGEANRGWFYIKGGKIMDTLPFINNLEDSLKRIAPGLFVQQANGFITLLKNGKLVQSYNYGNLITRNSYFNYDSLNYGLYKLENKRLVWVSKNADDIFKQEQGLFFIPAPGYGLIHKWDKHEVIRVIDSVAQLRSQPSRLTFSAVE